MATTTATQIQQLYVGLLGRAADQGGLNWWVEEVTTGGRTLEDIRASFVTSTEYTTTYGAATTRTDLVTAIYSNLFERTPSADELAYWVSTDTRPADQLVTAFLEFASTADQAVINNKTFVAQTYTDTVGNGFSAAGAAAVIADVDGTSASVAAAIKALNDGSLDGQVPALGLINAAAVADGAVTTFQTDNKAAVDALVTTLKAEASADFETALGRAEDAADVARDALTVDVNGTTYAAADTDSRLLKTQGQIFDETEATALAGLSTTQKNLAASYKATVAAEVAAKAALPTEAQQAAAEAGLAKEATSLIGSGKTYADGAAVTKAYVAADADGRKAIDVEFKDSAYYSTFKAVVVKDAAYADAKLATGEAGDKLTDTDTVSSTKGADYLEALTNKTLYNEFLTKVVAADTNVAAVKAIVDAYAVKVDAADTAHQAVVDFSATDVNIASLNGSNTAGTGDTVKDVFYFADKAAVTASDDFKIDSFKAGDSIVLGSGYTFNNGALSTGDGNKLEFFLVKGDNGVQLVLETAKYGSSDITTQNTTTGVIAANAGDHATVITLTGVTAEHVSVANGVVSYV